MESIHVNFELVFHDDIYEPIICRQLTNILKANGPAVKVLTKADLEESTYKLYYSEIVVPSLMADIAQQQHRASTTINNHTPGSLKRVRGDQFAHETILQDNSMRFVTARSEGYVIYEGTNVQGGPPICGWLLAWNVRGANGNQVYVKCGAKEDIIAMPVAEIYNKVEAAGISSTCVDAKNKASATANIEPVAVTPILGCAFAVDN